MKKISTQIKSLECKQQQTENRLNALRSRQARIDRAKETRRLVLAGKWLLRLHQDDWQKVGQRLTQAGLLVSERDKKLFDAKQPRN